MLRAQCMVNILSELTNGCSPKNSHHGSNYWCIPKKLSSPPQNIMQKLRESNKGSDQYEKALKFNQYGTLNSSDVSCGNADSLKTNLLVNKPVPRFSERNRRIIPTS